MLNAMRVYIRGVDAMNRVIGRIAMYLIFALMGVLLWSVISKAAFNPALWTLETAQFVMVAYYVIGGPYAIQMGSHVRMDLFYSTWTPRQKAWIDSFTVLFLLYYLGVLLYGAVGSTAYSLGYFGTEPFSFLWDLLRTVLNGGFDAASEKLGFMERSSSIWRPYMWPIKTLLCVGIILMLLQCLAELCRDILTIKGQETPCPTR